MEISKESFYGTYEEAMKFLVEIAHRYQVQYYRLDSDHPYDPSENDVWKASIEYFIDVPYTSYWYPNECILQNEEKIPFYVAVYKNEINKVKGNYIPINSSGSTTDFWKDEYKKLKDGGL